MNKNKIYTIENYYKPNSYPGRGIIIGESLSGKAVFAYFISGRSENSRNRIFVKEGESVKIVPYDPGKVSDPSLIIYYPVKRNGKKLIVTNGDQTDTINDFLNSGNTFEEALCSRTFEPDSPNWTPRISGLLDFTESFSYKLSILKSLDEDGSRCNRFFFNYLPKPGLGHTIHTYEMDDTPLPSFRGEPELLQIPDKIENFTEEIWASLDPDNKISLYTCFVDIGTQEYEERIVNKYK